MDSKTLDEIIEQASATVQEHWWDGGDWTGVGEGGSICFCVLGAIGLAAGGFPTYLVPLIDQRQEEIDKALAGEPNVDLQGLVTEHRDLVERIDLMAARAVREYPGLANRSVGRTAANIVAEFNDLVASGPKEVVDLMHLRGRFA